MLNKIVSSLLGVGKRSNQLPVSLTGLVLVFGFSSINANAILANGVEVGVPLQAHQQLQTKSLSPSQASQARITRSAKELSDGVYLYGQSSVPEQIGQEYMVFEVKNGRAIGAMYLPQSEFNCFAGELQGQELNVSLATFGNEEMAEGEPQEGQQFQPVAAASGGNRGNSIDAVNFPVSVKLQNYHRLATVSSNDHRILGTCKANYQ